MFFRCQIDSYLVFKLKKIKAKLTMTEFFKNLLFLHQRVHKNEAILKKNNAISQTVAFY